jgi:peptidoglycan/LPS O-acetylase OafA/YrhL
MQSDISNTTWMNELRALAVIGVVVHHWLLFVPYDGPPTGFGSIAGVIKDLGGTCVHLFFLLSGCGLAVSYFQSEKWSWSAWTHRRFRKIVVPYWIVTTGTFVLANIVLYATGKSEKVYSWGSLFSYLTFTRNHYEAAWEMNPTLWFMPVIFGLYLIFPFLVGILKKGRVGSFLIFAGLITYSSITLFLLTDYEIEHQSAIFLFFVMEFGMGMVLGYLTVFHRERLGGFIGLKGFILGAGLYVFSYLMTKLFRVGDLYNDAITSAGVFLITINIWNHFLRNASGKITSVLDEVSRVSYIMYLIHGALILYIISPVLESKAVLPLNPMASVVLSGVLAFVVFLLARGLYGPVMAITKIGASSNTAHT